MSLTKITLDFESYYADDYTLSKRDMTLTKYIRDPRFKAHGVGIKIDSRPSSWVTHKDLPALFGKIPWNKVLLIGHNLKFDASILHWIYGYKPALMLDTKSMSRALLGNVPASHSLDHVAQFLLGKSKGKELVLSKNIRDLPPHIESAIAGYCLTDVELTYEICSMLWPYFPRKEIPVVDWTIRMFSEPQLLLDKQRLLAHRDKVMLHKQELLAAVGNKFGAEVFRSNDKFAAALRLFGIIPPTKISPTTGKQTYAFAKTDEDFLELQEHEDPNVALMVQARLGLKTSIEETRALSYANHADFGAWPVDIEYCGAIATHRFSGAKGGGGNPQNLGRKSELRKSIIAPPGYVVVAADLSAIELRIAMALAQQEEALQILRDGGDIYCWFASNLFGRTITKADTDERFLGKLACLSLQYGCGWAKFQKIAGLNKVKLTDDEAKTIVATYRETFYKIPQLWYRANAAIGAMARGEEVAVDFCGHMITGFNPLFRTLKNAPVPCMTSQSGLRINYPGLRRDSNEQWVYLTRTHRKAHETKLYGGKVIENASQHLARLIIVENTMAARAYIPACMQVHDEVVSIVPEDEAQEAANLMLKIMSTPPKWWPNLPVSAEAKFGKTYGDAK